MNKREAAIVTAQTGVLIGKWDDAKAYFEELMGHSVSLQDMWKLMLVVKQRSKEDYANIVVEE